MRPAAAPRRRSPWPWRVRGSSKGGCWRRWTIGATAPFPRCGSALSSRPRRRRSSCRWRRSRPPWLPPAAAPKRSCCLSARSRVRRSRFRRPLRHPPSRPPSPMRDGSGTWEVRRSDTDGTVHLRLVEAAHRRARTFPSQQLEGLTAAQLTGQRRAGAVPAAPRCRDVHVRRRAARRRRRRHVLLRRRSEVPRRARQARLRAADGRRAVPDGASRRRLRVRRRAEHTGLCEAADLRARSRRSARCAGDLPP